ncbi:MAG: hypothetical protein JW993_00055 [Sedimentisphaerales bacterium]|nr:hypothetical protein [Sedimentisphaerales bacterium]
MTLGALAQATDRSAHHLNVIPLLGIAMFGGTIGARVFRRLRVPQIIGVVIGKVQRFDCDYLPVVASEEDDTFVGLLDYPAVRRALSAEVLSRQEKADNLHAVQNA